jgi:hypothetical protein
MFKKSLLFLGMFLGGFLTWKLISDKQKLKIKTSIAKHLQQVSLNATEGLLKRMVKKAIRVYFD